MAEYIDRESIYKTLSMENPFGWNNDDLGELFRQAKPADVAPVRHGRWIKESDGGTRCSVCNKRVRDVTGGVDEPVDLSDMPYCPKCGARMDGDCHADD